MIVKLALIRVFSESPLPPDTLLDKSGIHYEFPSLNIPDKADSRLAAHILVGDTLLFTRHEDISNKKRISLLKEQAGVYPDDLILVKKDDSSVLYCLALRSDRLPMRYLDINIDESKHEWCPFPDLNIVPELKMEVQSCLEQVKKLDELTKRTVNAALSIQKFTENFGGKNAPLKKPKKSDLKSVKWVYTELEAGDLLEEAVSEVISRERDAIEVIESSDDMYYLYRFAWRKIAPTIEP